MYEVISGPRHDSREQPSHSDGVIVTRTSPGRVSDALEQKLLSVLPSDARNSRALNRRGSWVVVFESPGQATDEHLTELNQKLELIAGVPLKVVAKIQAQSGFSELVIVEGAKFERLKLGGTQFSKKVTGKLRQTTLEWIIESTKPEGTGVWSLSHKRPTSEYDNLRVAFLRMEVPEHLVPATRDWLAGISREFGVPIILQPRRARNGITRQLVERAGASGMLTKPEQVEAIVRKLPGRRSAPEVDSNPIPLPEIPNLVDLRRTISIAIDPSDSPDPDDAISVEVDQLSGNTKLYISFADVSWRVKPGDQYDLHARSQCFSYYGLERNLLLFGSNLIHQLALVPGEDRLAFTVMFEIDPSGKVAKKNCFRSVINVDMRMSAEDVNALRAMGESDMAKTLNLMDWATQAARAEVQSESGFMSARGEGGAGRMVERAMISAKAFLGSFFEENGVPALYRVLAGPRPDLVQPVIDELARLGFAFQPEFLNHSEEFARLMNLAFEKGQTALHYRLQDLYQTRSHYSLKNAGHSDLRLPAYAEPKALRNYGGLVNDRQLAHILSDEPPVSMEELRKVERQMNRKKHTFDDVLFRLISYEKIIAKLRKVGTVFDARQIGRNGGGIRIDVPGLTQRGLLVDAGRQSLVPEEGSFPVLFEGYQPESKHYIFSAVR